MTHPVNGDRPRLLFFQWDHSPNAGLSTYLLHHVNDHVRCLGAYFDVTVVNADCDYAEICDRYEPDLVLFESGYRTSVSRRPVIRNVGANRGIPRLGFHNADSWSDCRSGFLSDMAHWGVETFFSICATTNEYLPCVKDQMYIWPNFIDAAVFRDYGLEKTIPVMLSGQRHEEYPWRQQVFPFVAEMMPCLNLPAFYHGSGLAHRALTGASYARALNASHFSLSCGTMAKEVVRKHFEIPGAKACLITEKSEALIDAGFVHMENCVFADLSDVLEAMDFLLRNPETLQRITQNGHELVHARHTLQHRPQIYQWYTLQRALAPGEEIVQIGPFGDLVSRPREPSVAPVAKEPGGLDRLLLRSAARHLAAGRTGEARKDYAQCLTYVRYLPEARFGLALCDLQEGIPAAAAQRLAQLVEDTTVVYGAADPDPIDFAYFILSVLCQGDLDRARDLCGWYPDLTHPELRRVKDALARLSGQRWNDACAAPSAATDRKSVQQHPARSDAEWRSWLIGILRASGQPDLAERLETPHGAAVAVPSASRRRVNPDKVRRDRLFAVLAVLLGWRGAEAYRPNVPPLAEFQYLQHIRLNAKRRVTRGSVGTLLRQVWRWQRGRWELRSLRQRQRHERS